MKTLRQHPLSNTSASARCSIVVDAEPAKLLAQALGLEHYDWLDYDRIASDFQNPPEDYPDVTEVP